MVWAKLQEVLASVEDSISSKRSWAAPITASDRAKQQQHLKAAEESWVKAAQVLKLSTDHCECQCSQVNRDRSTPPLLSQVLAAFESNI